MVSVQSALAPTEQYFVAAVRYVAVEQLAFWRIHEFLQGSVAQGKYVQPAAGFEAFSVVGVDVRTVDSIALDYYELIETELAGFEVRGQLG